MRTRLIAFALGVAVLSACQDPSSPDLNNPGVEDYSNITSVSQVSAIVRGLLSYDRGFNTAEILRGEVIGRDAYNLPVSEPRWVTDLLGATIDPGSFNGTTTWPFAPIRLVNIAVPGVDSAAIEVLSDEQKNATLGFMRTFKAISYLRAIETRDSAGAPINVDVDPTGDPVPLSCKADVYAYIVALLDSAKTNLDAGGSSFPFTLPEGFAGFDDPESFTRFNRGLAAKTNVYLAFRNYASSGAVDAGYLAAANSALLASFMDTTASTIAELDVGPQHDYSTGSGDAQNDLYGDPKSTDFRVNPRVITEADSGDDRLRKTVKTEKLTLSGISSDWAFTSYLSPTSPVSILTNKELILLKAEVEWGQGNTDDALALANLIRTVDGGLSAKSLSDPAAVLNQILYEKRYSLLWESPSRWIDARMFGKLTGDAPPNGLGMENGFPPQWNLPLPQAEIDARRGDLSKQCTSN